MDKEKITLTDNGEKKPENIMDFNDFDDVDPVNAYYKQRLSKSSGSNIFKSIESDNDSSLGVLDIDNVSVLDEMDNEIMSQDNFNVLNAKNLSGNSQDLTLGLGSNNVADNLYKSKTEPLKSELNLKIQRELAKKALLQMSEKLDFINKNLNSLEINNLKPKQAKTGLEKKILSNGLLSKGNEINWLDQNQSPQTPKFFKDELNSLNESSETPFSQMKNGKQWSDYLQINTSSVTTNAEGALASGDSKLSISDLKFESLNPADILNRFEEDEKKFIKEQSAVSNNSKLSQFSGIAGEDELILQTNELSAQERISIGKYFGLRSHSINSLIGEKGSQASVSESESVDFKAEKTISPTLVSPCTQDEHAENDEMNEAKIEEEPAALEKNKMKRWNSCNLKRVSQTSVNRRSNESSESTSTLLIQNLLCGMDSGLSGTQINDRLLECLGKMKGETIEKLDDINKAENMETPKSSRNFGKSGSLRSTSKEKSERNISTANLAKIYAKTSLDGKRSISKSCSEMSSHEFKENIHQTSQIRTEADKSILSLRNERVMKDYLKGFESSTPKLENIKFNGRKFKSACNKLGINDKDWEPPRVSSIQKSGHLSESLSTVECEKTLVVNSSAISFGNNKETNAQIQDTFSIEDTIAGGDLAIVSEKISELQQESCITGHSYGPKDILAVIQELAKYPKGSVDCSALTPLIRDQYPELLPTFSFKEDETKTLTDSRELKLKIDEPVVASPGSWVNISSKCRYKDSIFAAIGIKKLISSHVKNWTKDWLIVSLESISIQYQTKKYLNGTKINNEFHVGDFLSVSMKDTLVPPDEACSLKIYVTPRVNATLSVKLVLNIKRLTSKETQTEDILIRLVGILPQDNISITPRDEINFGVIPEECFEKKTIQISFSGICNLPIKIFTDKSENFVLSSDVEVDDENVKDFAWRDNEFYYTFREGSKRILKLEVLFRSGRALCDAKNTQVYLKGTLSVILDAPTPNKIVAQIPLFGCVAFAKFLYNPSCSPFIFRSTEIGKCVKRSFPLKNVGAIGIEFSLSVVCENSHEKKEDDLFILPKTFFLPKDEELSFDIIFSAKTKENYIRRYLLFQMKPNGQIYYDVELVGIVMPVPGGKSVSASSNRSGPTQSIYNAGNIAFKLMTTTQSLSWAAVPLDVELKQTFHIMNSSSCNAVARFSFRKERSAFRFVNDNGEVIEKLKKVLKPNCSNVMNVVFRPDVHGPHNNAIFIETNHLTGRKMISVNGYGGSPKIFIRNLKSDLNGTKIIRLVSSESESQVFGGTIEFINKGNVSGFVSIKTIAKVLSLSSGLEVEPSNFVLLPNSKVAVRINQLLKNDDIKRLLSGRDIGKLATVTVTTGDEPSRIRLRKLINEQGVKTSEPINFLMTEFIGEIYQDIDKFDDDKHFESVFRKNLETIEIAVIIERPMDVCDSTIFEDFEETVKEFVTILPASDYSVTSSREFEHSNPSSSKKFNLDKSNLSASSGGSSNSHNKDIKKWLATLERP